MTQQQLPDHHQFLTRPLKGIITDAQHPSPDSEQRNTLRKLVGIKNTSVHDLSFLELWTLISHSLDGDFASCRCCRRKEITPTQRAFVLTICGDFRDLSPMKRSWP